MSPFEVGFSQIDSSIGLNQTYTRIKFDHSASHFDFVDFSFMFFPAYESPIC